MPSENRQIFFLIENSVKNEKDNSVDLSGKMARNLLNRFAISEESQFEISGCYAYDNNCAAYRNKTGKPEGKQISAKEQRKRYREVNKKRKKVLKNLSNAMGTLDIMICGMKIFRDFNVSCESFKKSFCKNSILK